jgi:F0F1-type ATP synthase epsilon subunit
VPQGINGGDLVRVAAPDGSYHSIMVPSGLTTGQQFSVELLATGASTGASSAELQRLRMELDAERALRRETQQEAMRNRAALEALQMKRTTDHAYLRDVVKRQRRCLEQQLLDEAD